MRSYVAQAQGGKDTLELHQEKPLDIESQQALVLASQMVSEDSQQGLAPFLPQIQALSQKVQQAQQAQQAQLAGADPTAQVILKTQMAETQRKAQEAQSKMQMEMQRDQQGYQLKVAELQQKVQELQAKYSTQTNIDNQRNATDIAMANINNAARERVAQINAGVQMDQQQARLEHEQNLSAIDAINAADADIRQHGLQIQQQTFQQQAAQVAQQADAQKQAALADQQHQQQLQQNDQMHQQTLEQQAAAPQPTTPPQGQ
jgi:hypothetical protein